MPRVNHQRHPFAAPTETLARVAGVQAIGPPPRDVVLDWGIADWRMQDALRMLLNHAGTTEPLITLRLARQTLQWLLDHTTALQLREPWAPPATYNPERVIAAFRLTPNAASAVTDLAAALSCDGELLARDFLRQAAGHMAAEIDRLTVHKFSTRNFPASSALAAQPESALPMQEHSRVTDQPAPVPNDGTPIWELVVADMHARDQLGRERYGTPLQAGNGRDALRDAYEETLDLAVYLRQALAERDAKQIQHTITLTIVPDLTVVRAEFDKVLAEVSRLHDIEARS
jgi:hypothetical protein